MNGAPATFAGEQRAASQGGNVQPTWLSGGVFVPNQVEQQHHPSPSSSNYNRADDTTTDYWYRTNSDVPW
eukprot:5528162-Pyramimonas_sp.AAC.1